MMRSLGRLMTAGSVLGAASAAAAVGGLLVAAWGGNTAGAIIVGAGLTLAIIVFGLGAIRMLEDIREQQRRIIEQLETQTRVLHNAVTVVQESVDSDDR